MRKSQVEAEEKTVTNGMERCVCVCVCEQRETEGGGRGKTITNGMCVDKRQRDSDRECETVGEGV